MASVDVGVYSAIDLDTSVSVEVKIDFPGQVRRGQRIALELDLGLRQGPGSKLLDPWQVN